MSFIAAIVGTSAIACPAKAEQPESHFLEGLNACISAYVTGDVKQSFADWRTERTFKRTCDECGTISGSFKASTGEVVEVLQRVQSSSSTGRDFHCNTAMRNPRLALLPAKIDAWLNKKIKQNVLVPIANRRSGGELVFARSPEGGCAPINIVRRKSGVFHFEMIELNTRNKQGRWKPLGC